MTTSPGEPGTPQSVEQPVERFHATSGRFVGLASLAMIVALVAYLAVTERNVSGLRIGTGLVLFGVLVWLTQLRPSAWVYPETLLLRNGVRDTHVPLIAIQGVTMGRMLTVWTDDGRFDCIGIGKPLRKMGQGKKKRPSSLFGWDRLEAYTEESTPKRADATTISYPDYIEERLVSLVQDARRRDRRAHDAPEPRPTKRWAWREIVVLGAATVGFLVALML